MAFQYMFNFPALELEIARTNIALMTNDNSLNGDDLWKDSELFKSNIEHGFIAATALISAFDGILNYLVKNVGITVSNKRIKNIYSLFNKVQKSPKDFLNSDKNKMLKDLIHARNSLIHFENYKQGYSGCLKDIEVSGVSFDDIFKQKEMKKHYKNIVCILSEFASYVDMNIDFNVEVFTCDGMKGRFYMIKKN